MVTDPNPIVEDILRRIEARQSKEILGPRGEVLLKPLVDDRLMTYAKDGESYSLDAEQVLIRAARMQRDGMSLEAIRSELDLIKTGPQEVSLAQLQRAITNFGMPWLEQAIREGREPAESKTLIGYVAPDVDDPDPGASQINRTVPDAEPMLGPGAQKALKRGAGRRG